MTQTSVARRGSDQADDKNTIRPFHVNVQEADLTVGDAFAVHELEPLEGGLFVV